MLGFCVPLKMADSQTANAGCGPLAQRRNTVESSGLRSGLSHRLDELSCPDMKLRSGEHPYGVHFKQMAVRHDLMLVKLGIIKYWKGRALMGVAGVWGFVSTRIRTLTEEM